MRGAAAAIASTAALAAAACGGTAGDLIALEVSGGFEGDRVRLTVTQDGRGRCDDGALMPIPSERLIEAREVERELEGLAGEGESFEGQGSPDRRSYVARTQSGSISWTEGVPGLPPVLPRTALLAQQLRDDLCSGEMADSTTPGAAVESTI